MSNTIDSMIIHQINVMQSALRSNDSIYRPSKFWDLLAKDHVKLIENYGFKNFKRTINFRYQQWGVASLRDPILLALLKKLVISGHFPSVALMARYRDSLDSVLWSRQGRIRSIAYKIYVGLLWQYAELNDELKCLNSHEEPLIGGPLKIYHRERLISQDLATSSLELNLLSKFCDFKNISTIAEIGSGYGRLAYLIMKQFPHIKYYVFDIPPALAIAQTYLELCLGDDLVSRFSEDSFENGLLEESEGSSVRFSLPHQMADFPEKCFDLMINISTFQEMKQEQIKRYFELIDRHARGSIYIKGYARMENPYDEIVTDHLAYPYSTNWRQIYYGIDPIQRGHIEQIYEVIE